MQPVVVFTLAQIIWNCRCFGYYNILYNKFFHSSPGYLHRNTYQLPYFSYRGFSPVTTMCYQHSFYNWDKYLNHQRETSSNILCVCVDTALIGCCVITWSGSPPIRVEITVDWRTSHLQSIGGQDGANMWPQSALLSLHLLTGRCQPPFTEVRWPHPTVWLWSPWEILRSAKLPSSTDSARTLLTRWVCWRGGEERRGVINKTIRAAIARLCDNNPPTTKTWL